MPKRIMVRPKCLFGKVLLKFIVSRGVTQYELAEEIGISQAVIANFLRCTKYPSLRSKEEGRKAVVVRLADALGLDRDERKELYRARLIMFEKEPVWPPEIVDSLPQTEHISGEDAVKLFIKGMRGKPVATWARENDIAEVTALKFFNFLQGNVYAGSIDIASRRRSALSKVISSLSLSTVEKAALLRFFLEKLVDPDVVDVLTSPSPTIVGT